MNDTKQPEPYVSVRMARNEYGLIRDASGRTVWDIDCIECGFTFQSVRPDATQCSDKCRARGYRRRKRVASMNQIQDGLSVSEP